MGKEREEIGQIRNLVDSSGSPERSYRSMGEQPRLLYIKDLKKMFNGLGEDAIYGLLRSGEIPSRLVAGRWVTTTEAVENWLNSITNGTNDPEASDYSEVDLWRRS